MGDELGLVQGPGGLVLGGRGQPHPKVVAAAAPVQLVVPVTCKHHSISCCLALHRPEDKDARGEGR